MNLKEARAQVIGGNDHERLMAARVLFAEGEPSDVDVLGEALRAEQLPWNRKALDSALAKLQSQKSRRTPRKAPASAAESPDEVASPAPPPTGAVIQQLVHEIEPVLGLLRLHAAREVDDYEASSTKKHLDRIDEILTTFQQLHQLATSPSPGETVAELVRRVSETTGAAARAEVRHVGDDAQKLGSDAPLVSTIVSIGLRNAIEAMEGSGHPSIVISWGETDKDQWLTLVDNGPGIESQWDALAQKGVSTKTGHAGEGLHIARHCAVTLGGTLSLANSPGGGAAMALRWPRKS